MVINTFEVVYFNSISFIDFQEGYNKKGNYIMDQNDIREVDH